MGFVKTRSWSYGYTLVGFLFARCLSKKWKDPSGFFCQGIYAIKGSLKFDPPVSIAKFVGKKSAKKCSSPSHFWVICWMKGKVCRQQFRFFFIFFLGGGGGVVILHSLRPLSDVL